MFQLLNPIWLFGINGVLIPIFIHLWNVKKGKTLKIGSISLLGESSRQNARSLRLLDLILLLLRCLLIIIISTLLAEPVWIRTNSTDQHRGWILVEKDTFKETYSNFQKEIDSLDQAGYDLHLFEPGFKSVDLTELKNSEIIIDSMANQLSYWSLLKLLDQEILLQLVRLKETQVDLHQVLQVEAEVEQVLQEQPLMELMQGQVVMDHQ